MRKQIDARRAERRVAEDRAGVRSRQFARERLDSWVRARWRWLVGVGLLIAAGSLILGVALAGHPLTQGFAVGLFAGGSLVALYNWCLMASGAAGATLGEAGEEWTSNELRRLRRSGWRFVNGLQFRVGDIDHVAVGPDGVVVIESKWTSMGVDLDRPSDWRSQAVSQVRRNERDVAGFLGWGARKDARITSLVVVWGPQVRQQGDEAVLTPEGVNVLAGRHLRMVLGDLGEEALSPQEVEAIYTKLAGWIEKKDSWNASASAEAPVTLSEQAERAMWSGVKLSIGFVLVAAALVALAQLLT